MTTVPSVLLRKFRIVEVRVGEELRRVSLPLLRCALGTIFCWFGALELAGASPVGDLVAGTLPWFDRSWLLPAVGLFEVAVGLGMIAGRFLLLVCAVMAGHLCGTFLAMVMRSATAFQDGNPLLLTTEGEFVVKNLVLVAAVLVLAARFDRAP